MFETIGRKSWGWLHSGDFSVPTTVANAASFFVAAYAFALVAHIINNTSHTPTAFSHWSVLLAALIFILLNVFLSQRFGNTQVFSVKVNLATALLGSFVLGVVSVVFDIALRGGSAADGFGMIAGVFTAPFWFILAQLIRFLLTPILRVFEPSV